MQPFRYEKIEGKYCLLVKLLSFRSPFEYMYELERGVAKRVKNGLILIDEKEHNDNPDKRFIQVEVRDGKLREHTLAFVPDYIKKQDSKQEDSISY